VQFLIAAVLMGIGVWLHLTERHAHEHRHDALEHDHIMGSNEATTVETVITLGRKRSSAPSVTASDGHLVNRIVLEGSFLIARRVAEVSS
jgi:hypothetical protein